LSAEWQIDRSRFAHNALVTSLQKYNKISTNLQITLPETSKILRYIFAYQKTTHKSYSNTYKNV